jgi:hypothetical protein
MRAREAPGPRGPGASRHAGDGLSPFRGDVVIGNKVGARRDPAGGWSLEHLADNIGATKVAARLTGEEVRALTAVEDEESATLSKMPAQMVDALDRRRRGSV